LNASFELEKGEPDIIKPTMDNYMRLRKEKQPLEYPSCGSAFKRPVNAFAGALIEQCGLKGFSINGAEVSDKHAGFIINKNNAKANDIIKLIDYVSDTVFEKTGIRLEPEIRIIRNK
jgi:UDP-N-acetylmuramate dehydrogenase